MIRIYKYLSTEFSILVNKLKASTSLKAGYVRNCLSFINTSNCQLCDEAVANGYSICNHCLSDLPKIQTKCAICCLPISTEASEPEQYHLVCGECLTLTPSFTLTLCPFKYEFPVKQLIRQIKYSKKRFWVKTLSAFLIDEYTQALHQQPCIKPDLLIAIPMHKSKFKHRDYNHAELIAQAVSKKTGINLLSKTLIKIKPTDTQAQLNRKERMNNLKGSFGISKNANEKDTLTGKHIALIDDVMTTKSTCELVSQLLLDHGAKRVDVWCLARTPKFRAY